MQPSDEFYIVGREFDGALSAEQVHRMVAAGDLSPEAQVRRAFYDSLIRAGDVGVDGQHFGETPTNGAPATRPMPGGLSPYGSTAIPNDNLVDAQGWSRLPVAPWRRFGARLLDGLMFNVVLGFIVFPLFGAVLFQNIIIAITAVMTLYMAANSILIGIYTMTPGKRLFGIRVVDLDCKPIGVGNALVREIQVFVFGQLLCIPLISLIGLYLSYRRIHRRADTMWDENLYAVLLRPEGATRDNNTTIGIILLVVLLILGF